MEIYVQDLPESTLQSHLYAPLVSIILCIKMFVKSFAADTPCLHCGYMVVSNKILQHAFSNFRDISISVAK